jgi:exodeoxyribonuclease VII small subunit
MKENKSKLSDLTYEQAFSELEQIVESLETAQKPLDETVNLYERGQLLVQYCAALLEQANLRIRQLNPNSNTVDAEK